jgi:hypothetical protein
MSEINSVVSSIDTGTNIKFTGKSDSEGNNLRVEDGKLSGTIVGSVTKDFTGRVDDVTLELSNVPIEGVGGGSGGTSALHLYAANYVQNGQKIATHVFTEKPTKTVDESGNVSWSGHELSDIGILKSAVSNDIAIITGYDLINGLWSQFTWIVSSYKIEQGNTFEDATCLFFYGAVHGVNNPERAYLYFLDYKDGTYEWDFNVSA